MKRTPTVAVPAMVALVLLSGCGSDNKSTSPATSAASPASSAAASATDGGSSAPTGSASPSASDAGYHTVVAPGQKLTFAVPSNWVAPSGKLLQQPEIAQTLKNLDMMVVSEKPENGFAANLNVSKAGDNDRRLPTKDEAANQLASAQGTITGFQKVQTPLGAGEQIAYSMVTNGKTHQAVALEVPTADHTFALITVSSSKADEAASVAKLVLRTLKNA